MYLRESLQKMEEQEGEFLDYIKQQVKSIGSYIMGEEKVKLYATWRSPFSNRVEIALKLKGVEYELIDEDLNNKSPELLMYNPVHKKIPVLVHGSNVIVESQVILEYIDETWDSATPILPRDPYQRALARFWARFLDDKVFLPVYKAFIYGEEEAMEESIQNMKILEEELEGKRFFGGENIGFVDIVANTVAYWVSVFEEASDKLLLTTEAFPLLCRWRDDFLNRQVLQETLPAPKAKLTAVFKNRIDSIKSQIS